MAAGTLAAITAATQAAGAAASAIPKSVGGSPGGSTGGRGDPGTEGPVIESQPFVVGSGSATSQPTIERAFDRRQGRLTAPPRARIATGAPQPAGEEVATAGPRTVSSSTTRNQLVLIGGLAAVGVITAFFVMR